MLQVLSTRDGDMACGHGGGLLVCVLLYPSGCCFWRCAGLGFASLLGSLSGDARVWFCAGGGEVRLRLRLEVVVTSGLQVMRNARRGRLGVIKEMDGFVVSSLRGEGRHIAKARRDKRENSI
jgi:hypothetical protein